MGCTSVCCEDKNIFAFNIRLRFRCLRRNLSRIKNIVCCCCV